METQSSNDDVFDASQLICAVARQDKEAFARLFQYFAPRIKAMHMRKGLAEQRAEDLAQEAMLSVWRKAHQYNPEGARAAAWIFTIARNLRIDQIRRQS
ncbi:MAG: sigma-70 family RNA polymerase sigma factor [Hyphomicrobiaceae bacterium]